MFSQQHEYEGRLATHHKLETFHNPVSGLPQIYGKREMGGLMSKNVYDELIYNSKTDKMETNPDYIEEFSNGQHADNMGPGYPEWRSPYYNKVYNVTNITYGEAKVVVRVPLKAFENESEHNEPLYDTNVDVMWQPFGQTGMIKLQKGEQGVKTF